MEGRMALKQALPFSVGQLLVAAGFDWFVYCSERLFVYCFYAYLLHTGKCIHRSAGIYAYCRYFIDRKW